MTNKERQFVLPMAELIDRLTIDQIKELLIPGHKESFSREMELICNDLDQII